MFHIFYSKRMGFPEDGVEHVCALDTNSLGTVFREMNVVDGTEIPISLGRRSMCVGDIVLDHLGERAFLCAMVGWTELTREEIRQIFGQVPRDYRMFFPRCGNESTTQKNSDDNIDF